MKYDVELRIIVEAESEVAAFADVRSHYAIVNDPTNQVKDNLVDMFVGDVEEVDEETTVADYA